MPRPTDSARRLLRVAVAVLLAAVALVALVVAQSSGAERGAHGPSVVAGDARLPSGQDALAACDPAAAFVCTLLDATGERSHPGLDALALAVGVGLAAAVAALVLRLVRRADVRGHLRSAAVLLARGPAPPRTVRVPAPAPLHLLHSVDRR